MSGPRWEETRGALIGIADYALKYNTDDINMRFLNSDKRCTRVQVRLYPVLNTTGTYLQPGLLDHFINIQSSRPRW